MHYRDMGPQARLAWDAILQKPTAGIPSWLIHPMEHRIIERLAGAAPGEYVKDPPRVYLAMQKAVGTGLLDQWIPTNPLSMSDQGYAGPIRKAATQGADHIVCDGIIIDSPESVVEHLERFIFPGIQRAIADFDQDAHVASLLKAEHDTQALFGGDILKCPYGCVQFPHFMYYAYGYEAYFMAFALYPEVMERHFSLTADLAVLRNRATAIAYREGNLPPLCRLDHDMADSRGMLVDIRALDRIWFPHFARAIKPMLEADVRLIWHCDGNLMDMVPRLLECGLRGFQGFQYEDGMDYEKICRLRDRQGRELIIVAGVSVTTTLPHGTPDDVRRQMKRLVEHGPRTGLLLGGSSTICPATPWENIQVFVEGLKHYREQGRG